MVKQSSISGYVYCTYAEYLIRFSFVVLAFAVCDTVPVCVAEQNHQIERGQPESLKLLKDKNTRPDGIKELELLNEQSVPELRKIAFDESEDEAVRSIVLVKMGKLKSDGTRTDIEKCLLFDKSNICRMASAISLSWLRDKQSIPILKKAMNDDKSEPVRMQAAWALAKMGDFSGVEVAMKGLNGKDASAQKIAVDVLEEIGDKNVITELRSKARDFKDPWAQLRTRQAIYAIEMKSLQGKSLLDYLMNILNDEEKYLLQKWITDKMAGVGTPEAFALLKRVAMDPKSNGSHAAQKQLSILINQGRIGKEELLKP